LARSAIVDARVRQVLTSTLVSFTWIWAVVFIPIETYLTFSQEPIPLSGYVVNVFGVGITLWGVISLRRHKLYAEGVLAAGWSWTTAVFWRATNLRYWFASQGEALSFGSIELWLAPLFTILAGTALASSLVVLLNRDRQR
jgi:hypothetical protein